MYYADSVMFIITILSQFILCINCSHSVEINLTWFIMWRYDYMSISFENFMIRLHPVHECCNTQISKVIMSRGLQFNIWIFHPFEVNLIYYFLTRFFDSYPIIENKVTQKFDWCKDFHCFLELVSKKKSVETERLQTVQAFVFISKSLMKSTL